MKKRDIFRKIDTLYFKYIARMLEQQDVIEDDFWACRGFINDLKVQFKDEADDETLLQKIRLYVVGGAHALQRYYFSNERQKSIFWPFFAELFDYLKKEMQGENT